MQQQTPSSLMALKLLRFHVLFAVYSATVRTEIIFFKCRLLITFADRLYLDQA